MIYDTLKEGEGEMDYVNEVMETYSQSMAITDKNLEKALKNALEHHDILTPSQLHHIKLLKDFTEKFPQLYKQFITKGSTSQGFDNLK